MWSRSNSGRAAYTIAATIGIASLLIVHGFGFVLGTSRYWDLPAFVDNRMYVMGYRYFLYEPWHWPVFTAHTNLPYVRSIAFSDTPLLWALVNKAVATVSTGWRDYSAQSFLGLWYALTAGLQAVFGVANLRALGHKNLGATIVGSVFLLAMPAWTYRFPHASLQAHFLVLWALYLYIITPSDRTASRRLRVIQVIQLLVVSLLNVYLTVMSLAFFVASLVRAPSRRTAPLWFLAGCSVILASLAFAGYFAAEGATATNGFSSSGSNLLGPVLPMASGVFGDRLWVDVTGLQYEGVCYLGLGLLVLVGLVLLRGRRVIPTMRRHRALGWIAGAMALFALSNHVYIGSFRVLAYPIPHLIHWLPDQFRCPGRFSWLPMYVVVIFVLSRALTWCSSGRKRLLLLTLAGLQVFDVTPDWRRWKIYTDAPAATTLDVPTWRRLLASVGDVEVVPAHDCNSDSSFELATQIEYLTSEFGTPINGVYTARPSRDCDVDTKTLLEFHPRARTLYVFLAPMIALAKRLAANGLPCAEFGGGEVCSTDHALIESLDWPATPPPSPLGAGEVIKLADAVATYLEVGWASAEDDGRWTVGPVARLTYSPKGPVPRNPQLRIEGSALLCQGRTEETVDVAINGEPIGSLTFTDATNAPGTVRAIRVAHRELLDSPVVDIELRPRDFRSPHEVGCRRSTRELAIKVGRVWIEEASSQSSTP